MCVGGGLCVYDFVFPSRHHGKGKLHDWHGMISAVFLFDDTYF